VRLGGFQHRGDYPSVKFADTQHADHGQQHRNEKPGRQHTSAQAPGAAGPDQLPGSRVDAGPSNERCYINNKLTASPNTTKSSALISAKRKPLPLKPAK
jgi:hypothetical protein